jgi:hypothetical protein
MFGATSDSGQPSRNFQVGLVARCSTFDFGERFSSGLADRSLSKLNPGFAANSAVLEELKAD